MPSETQLAYFLQQLLNAAPLAALYAMLAFGYSLSSDQKGGFHARRTFRLCRPGLRLFHRLRL